MRARGPVGLVLAGGAARGAWEAGVLIHVLRSVGPDIGRPFPFRILSGTSVGAFHAALLAHFADDPLGAADALERAWRGLALGRVVKVDVRAVVALARGLLGRGTTGGRGAILSAAPFERLLREEVSFERIEEHLRRGLLTAITVSATHVASGHTTVFVARGEDAPPDLGRDPTVVARRVTLRAEHVLASAAIPMLFPAVSVDGELYCDGGLRQLVPLRPALRLGADALVVVSPRAIEPPGNAGGMGPPKNAGAMDAMAPSSAGVSAPSSRPNERAYSSPLYLLGKALDALLLDHVEADVERLEQINAILAAGRRRFGPGFEAELAAALGPGAHELRSVATSVVRPSQNLGVLAAEYVRSRRFGRRACTPAGRLLRFLAEAEGGVETDLVSYLLFDGEHAGHLLELGAADARARHDELCAVLRGTAPAARAA